jgi:hypothetical protein
MKIYIPKVTVSTGHRAGAESIARGVESELTVRLASKADQSAAGRHRPESTLSRSIADAVMKKVRL